MQTIEIQRISQEREVEELRLLVEQMQHDFAQQRQAVERQQWTDRQLAEFDNLLRELSGKPLKVVGEAVLQHLTGLVSLLQGVLYTVEQSEKGEPPVLKACSGYACLPEKLPQHTWALGQGLVGQAAKSQVPFTVALAAARNQSNATALANIQPKQLLVLPVLYNQQVKGVLELTLLNPIEEQSAELMDRLTRNLGAELDGMISQQTIAQMYATMQENFQQLQAQEEEMRQNVEELEATQEEMMRLQQLAELQRSQLQSLIDSTPDFIIAIDPNYRLILFNRSVQAYMQKHRGVNLELGVNIGEAMPGADNMIQHWDRALEGMASRDESVNDIAGQREYREMFFNPLMDDKHQVIGACAFNRNITQRKKQETAIRRMSAAFMHNRDSMWVLDGPIIADCNPASMKMFRVKNAEDMLGKSPADFAPEFQPEGITTTEHVQNTLSKMSKDDYSFFEVVHRRATGEDFLCEVQVTKFMDDGRELLLVTHRDISESRVRDLQFQRSRAVIQSSRDAIWVLENDRILEANPSALRMMGCDAETDIVGHSFMDFSPEHQPDGETSQTKARKMIVEAQKSGSVLGEWQMRARDGRLFICEALITPFEQDGKVYLSAVLRDISNRRNLQEQLRLAESRQAKFSSRLQSLIDCCPDAVYAIDAERKVVACNERFIDVQTRLGHATPLGLMLEQVVAPKDHKILLPLYEAALAGNDQDTELRFVDLPTGKLSRFRCLLHAIRENDGSIGGVATFIRKLD